MKMIGLLMFLFAFISPACAQDEPLAGGQCEYRSYKGQAKITSIISKGKQRNFTHEIYEVKFLFIADQEVKEKYISTKEKEFVLLLNNSNYPGPQFLEKYDIQVGNVFQCYMKVIVRGTCTPVVFEFPTIRLDDFFEN